ncbi:MAG: RIP metalloprotease RseP [Candidatus Latescibacteria bacterium]|nr:RIP metalloprotease RseP [bacterium]MBD3423027.1 RIP metalloprotease RseP [Candidatus Latescibacterota bacterium]
MLLTIISFIFVLSVVVFVHEFGHFILAKLNDVYVLTFSIGFGPKILKMRYGETEYAISIIPFGGYNKFAGETEEEEEDEAEIEEENDDEFDELDIPEHRTFRAKSPWRKITIILAGPAMNLLLAYVLYVGSIWVQGVFMPESYSVVDRVMEDSPAMEAGFERGDIILAVNGEPLTYDNDLRHFVSGNDSGELEFKVKRGADTVYLFAAPSYNSEEERKTVGLLMSVPPRVGDVKQDSPAWNAGIRNGAYIRAVNDTTVHTFSEVAEMIHNSLGEKVRVTWEQDGVERSAELETESIKLPAQGEGDKLDVVEAGSIGIKEYYVKEGVSFTEAIAYGSRAFWVMTVRILDFLKKLITGKASVKAVGGPLAIGKLAGDMVRWGFNYLISFIAFFSINLGIINLFPLLPFDGGHFVLYLFEGVSGRQVNARIKNGMMQVGFVLLIILMVMIMALDIFNLFG